MITPEHPEQWGEFAIQTGNREKAPGLITAIWLFPSANEKAELYVVYHKIEKKNTKHLQIFLFYFFRIS